MPIELPPLPYDLHSLSPHISLETLEYHYGKHHRGYVDKLNELIEGKEYEQMRLKEIVINSHQVKDRKVFNQAAQAWNHEFYWQCLTPKGGEKSLSEQMTNELNQNFGSYKNFKEEFTKKSLDLFGSGWTWLIKSRTGKLSLISLEDAENPLVQGETPLLTCDLWEHAYYIDYRNERNRYLNNFFKITNWQFVEKNLREALVSPHILKRENMTDKNIH